MDTHTIAHKVINDVTSSTPEIKETNIPLVSEILLTSYWNFFLLYSLFPETLLKRRIKTEEQVSNTNIYFHLSGFDTSQEENINPEQLTDNLWSFDCFDKTVLPCMFKLNLMFKALWVNEFDSYVSLISQKVSKKHWMTSKHFNLSHLQNAHIKIWCTHDRMGMLQSFCTCTVPSQVWLLSF